MMTRSLLLAATVFATISGSFAADNSLDAYNLTVQGIKMRTTAAIRARMLYVGTLSTDGRKQFTPYAPTALPADFPVEVLTSMDIDDVKNLKAKLSAEGIPGVNQPGIDIENGTAVKSSFVVLGNINAQSILTILNSEANRDKIEFMIRYPNPRIITSIATTLNYGNSRTAKVKAGATIDLTLLNAGTGSVKGEVESSKTKKVNFSDKTVFAYTMAVPAWKRDSQGRLVVDSLWEDKPKSLWQTIFRPTYKLPEGVFFDPKKVP